MVRTKVFVGNLSFTTKENELAKEFEAAGKVISANIITRGPRSLGYGFVEMDNETDAENAVKLLDKKEIDGRPINVEVAKPREEGADAAQSANAQGNARLPRSGARGGRGGASRGRGGASQGQSGAPRSNQGQSQGQGQGQQSQGQGQQGGRRRRQSDEEGENANQGGARRGGRGPRPPRATRPEGEADNRTPSTTTLFVANLPFSVEDDTFSKLLSDNSLAFKSAHVVKKRTGRSKGFGFIEFDNESDQQKALNALNNKDMDGRPLAVKVALTELRSPDQTNAQSSSPAPAKAAASPAPAKSTSSPSPAKTSSPAPAKNATSADKKDDVKPVAVKEEKK